MRHSSPSISVSPDWEKMMFLDKFISEWEKLCLLDNAMVLALERATLCLV